MHCGEHRLSSWIYVYSHKPHHRFTNPRLFDAFDGSVPDTMCMIVIPLLVTARIVPANVWSYMTFGTLYANWLVLIHSEYVHPWDWLFRKLGFGTAPTTMCTIAPLCITSAISSCIGTRLQARTDIRQSLRVSSARASERLRPRTRTGRPRSWCRQSRTHAAAAKVNSV